MRIWQAAWSSRDSQLVLWAESGQRFSSWWTGVSASVLSEHPFAAAEGQLLEDLERMQFSPDGSGGAEVVLPADDRGPLASARLLPAREAERGGNIEHRSFVVPALFLDAAPAIGFLSSLPSEALPGIVLDDSVTFWREATKLLLELLSRGSFLPTVQARNGGHAAFWQVIAVSAEDGERLDVLANAVPPICGALASCGPLAPRALIDSFLASCGDSLIRAFLKRAPIEDALSPAEARSSDAAAREWISALSRENSELRLTGYEAARFHQRIRRWAGPIMPETPQSLRTRFTLKAPKGGEEYDSGWELAYALDSGDDESESVPANEVWQGGSGFLRFSEFTLQNLEEKLLKDLGKASMFFEPVERSLREPFPARARLSTDEAYVFLKDVASLLESEGFGVQLPQWWQSTAREVGLSLRVEADDEVGASSRPSLLGLNRLVDFSWEVSVGDSKLTPQEFKTLVDQKSPLVRVGGAWVELRPADIEATFSFLDAQRETSRLRLIDALRLGLSLSADPAGLPVVSFEASGWVQRLLDAQAAEVPEVPVPDSFHGELRQYQKEGLSWLAFMSRVGCGACLADDMGLGKTIQFIALLLSERQAAGGERVQPTLLIVPMSILENWQREIRRFGPKLSSYVHHGSARITGEQFHALVENIDVVITTYNLAYRDELLFRREQWGRVALDEAQNIKNLNTKQTRSVRQIVHEQLMREEGDLCHRVALTGTPLENHLEELWSIFDVLNPGYLGTLSEFRSRFAYPIERYRDNEAAERLAKVVRPFVLRRVKSDKAVIDDLPEKIEMEDFTPLTQEQAALYQRIVEDMLPQVDRSAGMKRKGLVLATITKLKQVCDHPRLILKDDSPIAGRSGKLARLEELLEVILAEGDRSLVFTQYAQMGALLKEHLQERFAEEVLFMYGGTPQQTRQRYVDYFQSEKGPRIFVLSLKVGGLGLNLTAANQIIHFDQWWNPAVHEQATDRAFRIGQRKNVQVRTFLCRGTLEERIAELLAHKRDLADRIVASARNDVTQLSTQELRRLLELTAE